MKIYTKTGDRGDTGLFGGLRVSKSDPRIEAVGAIDELNSVVGLARSESLDAPVDALLETIQSELFDIGAEVGTVADKLDQLTLPRIGAESIARLEREIDRVDAIIPQLTTFVLPGGTRAASLLHLARTVCRRAERSIVRARAQEPVRDEIVHYVNRLSDLLFTWARFENFRANVPDVPWKGATRASPA